MWVRARERETQNEIVKENLDAIQKSNHLLRRNDMSAAERTRKPLRFCQLPGSIKEKNLSKDSPTPKAMIQAWMEGLKWANSNMMLTFSS